MRINNRTIYNKWVRRFAGVAVALLFSPWFLGSAYAVSVTVDFDDPSGYQLSGPDDTGWYQDGMRLFNSNFVLDSFECNALGACSYLSAGVGAFPGGASGNGFLGGGYFGGFSPYYSFETYITRDTSTWTPASGVSAPDAFRLESMRLCAEVDGIQFSAQSCDDTTRIPGFVEILGLSASGAAISGGYAYDTLSGLVVFDDSWADVTKVTIRGQDILSEVCRPSFAYTGGQCDFDVLIDDLSVSYVPVPAAVWLFASALGLLGAIRRLKVAKR